MNCRPGNQTRQPDEVTRRGNQTINRTNKAKREQKGINNLYQSDDEKKKNTIINKIALNNVQNFINKMYKSYIAHIYSTA